MLTINFNNQVLFDMASFSVYPITCSLLDANWFMSLPEVHEPETQTVKIEMPPDQADNLFTFSEETKTVFLNQETRNEVLKGNICPPQQSVSLTFNLESNVRSPSSQSLEVPVERSNFEAFEGVNISNEESAAGGQVKQLAVDSV